MNLHLRKLTQQHLEDARTPGHSLPSVEFCESELLDIMSEDDANVSLGRLTVLSADLLEGYRRYFELKDIAVAVAIANSAESLGRSEWSPEQVKP